MYEQLSMENVNNELEDINLDMKKIDIVKMEFIEAQTKNWVELFEGFDRLHAITYSGSIEFICNIIKHFHDVEIIFGYEEVISFNLQEAMAFQIKLIERIRNTSNKYLTEIKKRIDNSSLKLLVARETLSHEKLYLLDSNDGRKRVIMGSANMSFAAFSGKQRENICYIDGDNAYHWYMNKFIELQLNSCDNISKKALLTADDNENIDEVPIAQTTKINKVLSIETDNTINDEINFVLNVKSLAKKLKPLLPQKNNKGKILLTPEKIINIKKQAIIERTKEQNLRNEYPQLIVDISTKTVTLNCTILNLNPSQEEIQKDIRLFIDYMDGFQKFHGDTEEMQERYFQFANWFFSSPFMANLRNTAAKSNRNLLPFPVFGLIYGHSKAGKTSFLGTLLKMMIGQQPKISASEFTKTSIVNLKHKVQGAPIIVDDMTSTRFSQHAIETIKNEEFGLLDNLINYPAVVISANEDVKVVAPEIRRRTVVCLVQAGLTNTEVIKNNIVRKVQNQIGTAFYREYLKRMLDEIPDLLNEMKDDDNEAMPDILAISSKVIVNLIKENITNNLPSYVRNLSLEDYFSERVTGSHIVKIIKNAWEINKKSFIVDKKYNRLKYNAIQTYEADKIIKELPEDLEATRSREWIIMDLSKASEYFGIKFNKGLLWY